MARFVLAAFADEAADRLEDQIEALRAQDIRLIELRGVNGKGCDQMTLDEARAVAGTLRAAGIGFSALGSPCGKYPIDQPMREDIQKYIAEHQTKKEVD